ncbi:hypothetical protein JG687_00011959 [Phytophthora cactorum]|uniref:Uncharacterized protein n=1 Tax=Phytophthora cactorum TaxID=29920 RepID=A0A8T1U7S5_9STRA|nr:hypothetical protein PC120_g22654 [Phytophthora cactorum]KAG3088665.1 hypothetical protein PC121_g4389 [Phytophthora cactorum]KAG4041379.1 hypothetical protein PC123_g23107 [Phytophthora cactorum]KAG6954160.1 hypothetical protein JG687_00011959 [Phytophthora cactorum]
MLCFQVVQAVVEIVVYTLAKAFCPSDMIFILIFNVLDFPFVGVFTIVFVIALIFTIHVFFIANSACVFLRRRGFH